MGITTDARHPANTKIERRQFITTVFAIRETSFFQEGDDERAETAVDVKTNVVLGSKRAECDDIILITIREVDRGTYELRENRQ